MGWVKLNSGLFVQLDNGQYILLNREWQIVLRFFFLIEFMGCFCITGISDHTYLINIGWIRIRMDLELWPGSGSRTWKIQSWIRIRNKSFRIHITELKCTFRKQIAVNFIWENWIRNTRISYGLWKNACCKVACKSDTKRSTCFISFSLYIFTLVDYSLPLLLFI